MFDGEMRYLELDHGKYWFFHTKQQKVIENKNEEKIVFEGKHIKMFRNQLKKP